jgi:transcriptional regulator with XRE-family HTH domain
MTNIMFDKQEAILDIGRRIRRLREERGRSLHEFAAMVDMEYTNIVRLEKGRTNPTIGTLVKIAAALEVPLRELFA